MDADAPLGSPATGSRLRCGYFFLTINLLLNPEGFESRKIRYPPREFFLRS